MSEGSSQSRADDVEDATAKVRVQARALGFDAVAIARADVPLEEEMDRYEAFLAAGMHAEMSYLAENKEARKRLDTSHILQGARSVVCVAAGTRGASRGKNEATRQGRWLRSWLAMRAAATTTTSFARSSAVWRPSFDPSRDGRQLGPYATTLRFWSEPGPREPASAFIGKNGLLIVPGQGSFVLLGEVVTTLPLCPDPEMPGRRVSPSKLESLARSTHRCGECTLCLDACPTNAFPRPFVLDARRCIAYWTIEHRGAIPEPIREELGEHLFGCDECQTVCPFNASERPLEASQLEPFQPSQALRAVEVDDFFSLDPSRVGSFEGSPFKRPGAEGMARNAAIVLGNRRDPATASELASAAQNHPSPVVREAAAWALSRLPRSGPPQ